MSDFCHGLNETSTNMDYLKNHDVSEYILALARGVAQVKEQLD